MIDKPEARTYLRIMERRPGSALIANIFWVGLLLALSVPSLAAEVKQGNAGREGQSVNLDALPVKGKTTVVECYSPFCPPCRELAPLLEKLAEKRADLEIIELNINRPEVRARIDWDSPLAKQFGLAAVPYFLIFNPQGRMGSQGREALQQVRDWLKAAGILQESGGT